VAPIRNDGLGGLVAPQIRLKAHTMDIYDGTVRPNHKWHPAL